MNKIKALLFVIILAVVFKTNAQDIIFLTNGNSTAVKVIEVNSSSVKYRLANATNDKVFELSKNDIHYIIYENGRKEFYNTSTINNTTPTAETDFYNQKEEKPKEDKKDFHKNIIAINCFDMLFTNFSASYERIFVSGKASIKVPLSVGLGGKPNDENYTSMFGNTQFLQNKIVAAGLELNLYPLGQTRHTFYLGLSTMVGSFHYYRDSTVAVPGSYYNQTTIIKKEYTGVHYCGMVHIGGYLRLSENFLIGAKLGIGYKYEETILMDYTFVKAQLDLNLAYRF